MRRSYLIEGCRSKLVSLGQCRDNAEIAGEEDFNSKEQSDRSREAEVVVVRDRIGSVEDNYCAESWQC